MLGLDGCGGAERFADYSQWDAWQMEQKAQRGKATKKTTLRVDGAGAAEPAAIGRKKLTFGETREFETIEQRLAEAEQELRNQIAVTTALLTKIGSAAALFGSQPLVGRGAEGNPILSPRGRVLRM